MTELDAAVEDIQERAASIESVKSFLTDKLKDTEATVVQLEDEKNQLKAQKNSDQEVRGERMCGMESPVEPPVESPVEQCIIKYHGIRQMRYTTHITLRMLLVGQLF